MNPLTEERNLTPSSTSPPSGCVTTLGTSVDGQIVHGQFSEGGVSVVNVAGAAGEAGLVAALPDASADLTR